MTITQARAEASRERLAQHERGDSDGLCPATLLELRAPPYRQADRCARARGRGSRRNSSPHPRCRAATAWSRCRVAPQSRLTERARPARQDHPPRRASKQRSSCSRPSAAPVTYLRGTKVDQGVHAGHAVVQALGELERTPGPGRRGVPILGVHVDLREIRVSGREVASGGRLFKQSDGVTRGALRLRQPRQGTTGSGKANAEPSLRCERHRALGRARSRVRSSIASTAWFVR